MYTMKRTHQFVFHLQEKLFLRYKILPRRVTDLILKHWLHISYQLNIHLEQMYNEEVLHSHIRRQNISDEFKPTNFKVYIIDLG